MRRFTWINIFFFLAFGANAQLLTHNKDFTKADTLRGMLSELRSCYDVVYYNLDIAVDPKEQSIAGFNTIRFLVKSDFERFQIDLFDNMTIDKITFEGEELDFEREANAVFVNFNKKLLKDELNEIDVYYSGKPVVAEKPPWDGGFVWEKDQDGNPWIAVACEGIGASLWWPNKDHLSDEPDSMTISVIVPDSLVDVSNGQLRKVNDMGDGWKQYEWFVSYPINNYNVTVNIGNYAHFSDSYTSDGDTLALDYYVMPYNLEKAKKQFEQVKPMMECYEQYFGRYPFWRDGYKLVETPYLGMEHQGAIAYGNEYKTGYAGWDYSRIGLDFDYIIIHESGHEWWGNAVSCADIADLWIHEGFCTYSEALYVECLYGYDTALKYINAKKAHVENKEPVIGVYNVNEEGSGDMYNKGMLILNTLRNVLHDDDLWFRIIRGIVDEFSYKTINTAELVEYINRKAGQDLTYFFDQYLKYPDIPVFEYKLKKRRGKLKYRWVAAVENFKMPLKVTVAPDHYEFIYPTTDWQEMRLDLAKRDTFQVAEDLFYMNVKNLKK